MARSDLRRKLIGVGVFILPVLIVKGTGLLLTPADVAAAPGSSDPAAGAAHAGPGDRGHEWSEQQLAAARYVTAMADEPFGTNPLYYKPVADAAVTPPVDRVEPRPDDPAFRVTAVMKATGASMALVDDTLHRVGDTLRDAAWEIAAIDQENRAVSFRELATGRILTKRVPLPE